MFYTEVWTCGCRQNIASPCGEYALRRFDPDFIFEMEDCPALWLNGGLKNKVVKCSECLIKDVKDEEKKVRATRYISLLSALPAHHRTLFWHLANDDIGIGTHFGRACTRD